MAQFVKLKEFYRWRDDNHEFVKLEDVVDKQHLQELKLALGQVDPDNTRKVFDYIDKRLGKEFTYQKASIVMQVEVPEKFGLTPLQSLLFGFICPDHEFKAKLTLFMY
jgi:hypothetical protein